MIVFTLDNIIGSIAAQLREQFTDENGNLPTDDEGNELYQVYADANQQGTVFPCFFVFLMPSNINDEIDGIQKREISFDVVFVQQRNITNARSQMNGIADMLDEILDPILYTAGDEIVPLHTYDRSWSEEDGELHYKFTIKQRVTLPKMPVYMRDMEEQNVEIESGN